METKEKRTCPLCGRVFYSNKRIYCETYHTYLWNVIRKGSPVLSPLLALLSERGVIGGRIEGHWVGILEEIGWIERDSEGYSSFTQWGLDRFQLMKEQGKWTAKKQGYRNSKDNSPN